MVNLTKSSTKYFSVDLYDDIMFAKWISVAAKLRIESINVLNCFALISAPFLHIFQ